MDEADLSEEGTSYRSFRRHKAGYALIVPVAVLLVVVAVVSGLVFGGVIQGDADRPAPEHPPTTPSTVLIVP